MMMAEMIDQVDMDKVKQQVATGLNELLEQAHLNEGDLVVLGLSTSEVHGGRIGKESNVDIARDIVKTIIDIIRQHRLHLAVQGCEHLNRALVVERSVAKERGFEQVTVFPAVHAGGSGQIAAFENFHDPIEVEHITAEAGMDIGDTSVGMHVKFVQVPVRTSVKQVGLAHTTYLRTRPKLIGGARAKYEWDPFGEKDKK